MLAFPCALFKQTSIDKVRGNSEKCRVGKGNNFVKVLKNLISRGIGPDEKFLAFGAELLWYESEYFTSVSGGRLKLII